MANNTKSGAVAPDYRCTYTLIHNPTGNALPLDTGTPEKRLRWLRSTKMLLEALELIDKTEHETNVGEAELTFLPTEG
jgi:hypothetical protein